MWRSFFALLGCFSVVFAWAQVSQPGGAVVSVNGAQGAVTIATYQRQASSAIDATPGTITWNFPITFTNPPTCFQSLVSPSSTYSFDDPIVNSISTSAVTIKVTAHPTSLSITGLTLPIVLPLTSNPPAGTTITLTCLAPLP